MTVPTSQRSVEFNGNGSTTLFPVPYPFLEPSHLAVTFTVGSLVTPRVLGSDYVVTPTGSVQFFVAPPTGTKVTVQRTVPITQEIDYVENDPFPAQSHEEGLDKLTMIAQQLSDGVANSLQLVPDGAGGFVWDARGSRIIRVGNGVQFSDAANLGQAGSGGGGGGGGSFPGQVVTPKFWEFVGNGTETEFTITGADVADALYYDVAVGGVAQNPDDDYDVIVSADSQFSVIRFSSAPPNGVTGWVILRSFTGPGISNVSPQLPVFTIPDTAATLDAGYRQGHILCTAATAVTLTLRANNGNTALDWKSGDYFTIVQKGTGQVTVSPAAGVVIEIPSGFFPRTRARYSPISFVCDDPSTNTWTIGNDMATS